MTQKVKGYSDKHSVFRVNKPEAKGGQAMTQFGRALSELNIEILCANSSQAKGRVERANRTLQDRLQEILCWKEKRYVTGQLAVSYERKRLILEENEVTSALPGKYVETRQFADGRLEVLWNGVSLPFRVFDKDQRVSHTA